MTLTPSDTPDNPIFGIELLYTLDWHIPFSDGNPPAPQ